MSGSAPSPSDEPQKQSAARLTRLSADVRDQLVAYLDGELDESETQNIDQLLATNEVARREVERLSKSYELLDHLPQQAASTEFTQATMKSVQALQPVERDVSGEMKQRVSVLLPFLKTTALAFVCTLGGLFAGQFAFANDSDAILRDLDAIERVDQFRAVGDPEFIKWISADSTQRRLKESIDVE